MKGSFEVNQIRELGVLIWVVCYKAEGHITTTIDFDDVAAYRRCRGVDGFPTVDAGVGGGALYYLEIVAVYVERMAASIEIVDHYLNYVVVI